MKRRANLCIKAMLLLAKHWLSLAVAFSAVVGWFLFLPEASIGVLYVFLGTLLMSGGAAALNQYQERDQDVLMNRTRGRPIPTGEVSASQALLFSIVLIVAGAVVFAIIGFFLTLLLGLANIALYNLIYTSLKTKTQFAVIPGALVGAIPPIMGWVASGGQIIDVRLFYFAVFMFLWQMPHFWLLMATNAKDYQKAGFEVISNKLDQGKVYRLVFLWAVISCIYLLAMPVFYPSTPIPIVPIVIILNLTFVISFYRMVFGTPNSSSTNSKAFMLINLHAFAATLLMVVSRFLSV